MSNIESGFYYWHPIVSADHNSWLGISVEDIQPRQRSWVFDIVDTDIANGLPLTIGVEPDVVSVSVFDSRRPNIRGRVLLDYNKGPRDIYIPRSLLPPDPWELDLSLTWSSEAIAEMLMQWTFANVQRDDIYLISQKSVNKEPTYGIGSNIKIADSYFDYLLALDHSDSSMIIGVLISIADFLGEQFN